MSMGSWVRTAVIAGGLLVGGAWLLDWVEAQAESEIVDGVSGAAARKAAEKVKPPTGGGAGGGGGGSAGRTKDKDEDRKRSTTKPIGNSVVVPMPQPVVVPLN